jgi:hypothetical protein
MQVLVLAAQNAVDYEYLGVATSGRRSSRRSAARSGWPPSGRSSQIGWRRTCPRAAGERGVEPGALARLPPAVHEVYARAITDALHPVFLAAAGFGALSFVLSWLLQEVPLRTTTRAPTSAAASTRRHDDDRFRELTRALSTLAVREERWDIYQGLADRAAIQLEPPELWLLARLGQHAPTTEAELAGALHADDAELRAALAGCRRDRSSPTTTARSS